VSILIYSSTAIYRSSLVLLDEAEKCIKNGEKPIFLTCDGSVTQYCFTNVSGNKSVCALCRWMRRKELESLSEKPINLTINDVLSEKEIATINEMPFEYKNTTELKSLKYKGVDIGYASFSHYISCTRSLNPVFTEELRKIIDGFLRTSVLLVETVEKIIEQNDITKILLFNGRTFDTRPVFRLGKMHGINTSVMEIVPFDNIFYKVLFDNSLPHNVEMQGNRIRLLWDKAIEQDKDRAIEIANSFFQKRRIGTPTGDRIYTKDQESGCLPSDWDVNKKNITFFVSSSDEFASIDEAWDRHKFETSQLSCISKILNLLKIIGSEYHLYVRLHPNLKGIKYSYHTDYYKLKEAFSNVTVISPESPISTYSLIDRSDKVIVFGTTVGIESVYWDKPVILLGPAFYKNLDCCYIPHSDKELDDLLRANLKPKDKTGALMYGYSIMNPPRIPFENLSFDLFWPNILLKILVRNKNIRDKILKRMYPSVKKASKSIASFFHLLAGKKLKKFNSDQFE
jgi:hypothetical protein